MNALPDLLVLVLLMAVVFASLWAGLWLGRRVRRRGAPDSDHLGTIQGGLLGLLGLLLGFSFSGAMTRFIERQDALATEANAIENAWQRAELLPTGERVKERLGEYARLRLELFHELREREAAALTVRLTACYEAARLATFEGVRAAPQFATVAVPGIEAVADEFARRSAIARRHLPGEMVLVLVLSSGLALWTVGYGVGLAARRSVGSAVALAGLVGVTLFVTLDFDRPRRGLIALDPAPLRDVAETLNAARPGGATGDALGAPAR